MSKRREIGGVRGGKAGGIAPPERPVVVDPLREIVSPSVEKILRADSKQGLRGVVDELRAGARASEKIAWVRALVSTFHPIDPQLLLVRELGQPLDVAIAYSLPEIAQMIERPNKVAAEMVGTIVRRLRNLTYDDGSPVFPDPTDPQLLDAERPEQEAELTARLGEVAVGLFADPRNPGDRETYLWKSKAAAAGELALERSKFLQRGRAVGTINGPRCPRCGSRNTVVMTLQLRANDEAPTSQFVCHNCGYASAR